jgi:uncharacterized protein
MKVLISGSHGLVGSALVASLAAQGHTVQRLVRGAVRADPQSIAWDPAAGKLDPAALEGLDAVVHLAGENLATGRWTEAKMARIRSSRVEGTRQLAEALAQLGRPPKVLASASAIGYYGSRGDEPLDESSPPGAGFLADVCRDWEAATAPAAAAAIRVVPLRIGPVWAANGGVLARIVPPFRFGLGGPLGDGRQYMSWITLDDLIGVIRHVLATDTLAGPVNLVAPQPVTNREFSKTLGRVLRRPAVLAVPAFALRLLFGKMADELLLGGARVLPRKLLDTGYRFADPQLEPALRRLLT